MSLTGTLYRSARLSNLARNILRGPFAFGAYLVRRWVFKTWNAPRPRGPR